MSGFCVVVDIVVNRPRSSDDDSGFDACRTQREIDTIASDGVQSDRSIGVKRREGPAESVRFRQ